MEYFTAHGTFGRVLTAGIEDYRAGDDPWLGKICAGKISVGSTVDAWFADELEFKRENLLYGQATQARKMLRAIRRENEMVRRAQSLAEVQDLARQRSRIPPRRPNLETQLRRRGEWDDAGKLKRWLTDDLTRELNEYAKEVMLEIEAEREAAR